MSDLEIEGVKLEQLSAFGDERGSFVEMFRATEDLEPYRQANHSHSKRGVLRGLHYHRFQADLWYLVKGRAQVALGDLRTPSRAPLTASFVLDSTDPTTLFIPAGIAHGFLALTDLDLIYLVTKEYDGTDEHGIAWDDPTLGIEWPVGSPILSERDARNRKLDWEEIPRFS